MTRRWPLAALFLLAACGRQAATAPGPRASDVILITLDTVRADSVGFSGSGRVSTPVLDRLAAGGRVFTDAHAHNVVTLPSHVNILTGRYPWEHGVRENSGFVLAAGHETLATLCRRAGLRTAAFVGAYPLDARFGLDRDFEVYDDEYPLGTRPDQYKMAERRGDEVVSRARAWWLAHQGKGERRCLWVHLYDPHAPYLPPPAFATRFPDQPYLGEIAATDAFLAPLLEPLIAAGAAAGTLVVVTADHGEALGDHGELTHGIFAYEATLKVPLLLWGPGIEVGRDSRPARHVDILPTIAAVAAMALPAGSPGRSLLAAPDEAVPTYFEALSTHLNRGWAPLRGVLAGGWKWIELPLPELYDLATDPAENVNRIERERRRMAGLRTTLPHEDWPPRRSSVVSDEEARNLRALGYLVGDTPDARSAAGPADDPKNLLGLDQLLQEMVRAYGEARYEDAVGFGRRALAVRPATPEAYENAALALRQLERHEEAITLLRQGIAAGAGRESLQRELGMALAETGRADEAVKVLSPLTESAEASTINALAIALSDLGRHGEGEALLRRQAQRTPDDAKTQENLGIVLLRQGRAAEARDTLTALLERNPQLPISWNTLGVARYQVRDPAGAIDAWRRAADLDPRQLDALFNRGLVAAELGRTSDAHQALAAFLERAPRSRAADIAKARQILSRLQG